MPDTEGTRFPAFGIDSHDGQTVRPCKRMIPDRLSAAQAYTYKLRWTPETGQVAKRESSLGTAGWPKVRYDQYTEETRA